jgi:hypothetical protein
MVNHRIIQRFVCFLCLVLAAIPALVYPRDVEFPLVQSMSYFPYADNSLPGKGKYALTLDSYYSNFFMFNRSRTTLNDFEVFSTTIGFRYGIIEGGTLEFYYRHSFIFGGILDKLIEDFHSTFGLPNASRPLYPRNAVHYWFHDSFYYIENQNAASHLTTAFLKRIYQSSHFSIKARAALGIPLSGKPGFSSGKLFVSAGVVASYKKNWFSLELSNYLTFPGKPSWLPDTAIHPVILFSQLEARMGRWIGGFTLRTSVFKEGDVANEAYQVYTGFELFKHLELIIMEDLAPFDTTPDISFNLRIKIF